VKGVERLERAIREDPELERRMTLIYCNPPPKEYGKDYNELLCAVRATQAKAHEKER